MSAVAGRDVGSAEGRGCREVSQVDADWLASARGFLTNYGKTVLLKVEDDCVLKVGNVCTHQWVYINHPFVLSTEFVPWNSVACGRGQLPGR